MTQKFTFTGPPANHTAKKFERLDYSHSAFEQMRINADNGKLCKKLLEISTHAAPTAIANRQKPLPPAPLSGAAINRRRREDKIARDNLTIFKRLQVRDRHPNLRTTRTLDLNPKMGGMFKGVFLSGRAFPSLLGPCLRREAASGARTV